MVLVAKSYQGLPTIGDVYVKGGRTYIKVQMKNGSEKEVRVYNEKEYARMYPECANHASARSYGPQMNCFGFENQDDYIIIFVGNIIKNEPWFNERTNMRYHRIWGWYVIDKTYPIELPENIYPCKLFWSEIGQDDGYLKDEAEIIKVVKKKIKVDFFKKI